MFITYEDTANEAISLKNKLKRQFSHCVFAIDFDDADNKWSVDVHGDNARDNIVAIWGLVDKIRKPA